MASARRLQLLLSHSEAAALSVLVEARRHEQTKAFEVAGGARPETVTVRVTPHAGRAERLHVRAEEWWPCVPLCR